MSLTYTFPENYFDYNYSVSADLNSNTSPCLQEPPERSAALALCVLLFAIFLLAIPGNLLVGWVICSTSQPLTPSDVYLFHLTIADGLMAVTLPFFAIAKVWGWVFGDFMCKLLNLIIEANFYTSIIFLVCISMERCRVIVQASETGRANQRRCSRVLCGTVWVVGWALALPALFHSTTLLNTDLPYLLCIEIFDIGSSIMWRLVTRGISHILGFLLPLMVMVICYSITITRLLRTRGFHKHRAMRVITAVVIAFLLCWTPYHVTLMVDTLLRADLLTFDCNVRTAVNKALIVTNSLALVHSCINPFLYAFVGEKFRKNLKRVLQKKLGRDRMSSSRSSLSTSQMTGDNRTAL